MLVMRIGDAFTGAIRTGATGIFLVHNHPSGKLEPSDEDVRLTREVAEAGLLLGYTLLDHVIVARTGYRSLLDKTFMRAHSKRFNITNTVLRESSSGCYITEWRCVLCRERNRNTRLISRIASQSYTYLPSRCSHCGGFAWLRSTGESASKNAGAEGGQ